jgi:hypothetical protein
MRFEMMSSKLLGIWLPWVVGVSWDQLLLKTMESINPDWPGWIGPNIVLQILEICFLVLLFSVHRMRSRWADLSSYHKEAAKETNEESDMPISPLALVAADESRQGTSSDYATLGEGGESEPAFASEPAEFVESEKKRHRRINSESAGGSGGTINTDGRGGSFVGHRRVGSTSAGGSFAGSDSGYLDVTTPQPAPSALGGTQNAIANAANVLHVEGQIQAHVALITAGGMGWSLLSDIRGMTFAAFGFVSCMQFKVCIVLILKYWNIASDNDNPASLFTTAIIESFLVSLVVVAGEWYLMQKLKALESERQAIVLRKHLQDVREAAQLRKQQRQQDQSAPAKAEGGAAADTNSSAGADEDDDTAHIEPVRRLVRLYKTQAMDLATLFEMLDVDASGRISTEEMRAGLLRLNNTASVKYRKLTGAEDAPAGSSKYGSRGTLTGLHVRKSLSKALGKGSTVDAPQGTGDSQETQEAGEEPTAPVAGASGPTPADFRLSKGDIEEIVTYFDHNGDGELSFVEFKQVVGGKAEVLLSAWTF